MDRRQFLSLAAVAGAFELADAGALDAANAPETVAVDYAYYNPVSLLLKKKGWLEAESFAKDGIALRWVLSLRIKQGAGVPAEVVRSTLARRPAPPPS